MINKKRRGMKVERNEHRIDVRTNTEKEDLGENGKQKEKGRAWEKHTN